MRAVSFNVNGIRARLHQIQQLIEQYSPDIIGLQETKVADSEFPEGDIKALGYHTEYFGQKGHYGVALLTREDHPEAPEIKAVSKGFDDDSDEEQRRWIKIEYAYKNRSLTVANGYFPQGENRKHPEKFPNKERFYEKTYRHLQEVIPTTDVILMGDMNISHQDIDIGIGEKNKKRWLQTGKCSFLPEEREWLNKILDLGMKDTFRLHYPEINDQFSWFDYRSRGFEAEPRRGLRIDLILASKNLADSCHAAGIALDIRGMEKPSDHSPIWADFE